MKNTQFQKYLRETLAVSETPELLRKQREMKADFLKSIDQIQEKQKEKMILSSLRSSYKKPSRSLKIQIKNLVFAEVERTLLPVEKSPYSFNFFLLFRKIVAGSFASLLLFVTLLAPFQTIRIADIVSPVHAAYLECHGVVYVNGLNCLTGIIQDILPGDHIVTNDRSMATIFYPDYSLIRLDEDTDASVSSESKSLVHVESGDVWIQSVSDSSGESLHVSTPYLKANVPQGSVGISSRQNYSQLLSKSAVVEVQVDSPDGNTQVVTVSPDRSLSVRKTQYNSRVVQSGISSMRVQWVEANTLQDIAYIDEVKKKTVQEKTSVAGVLPGSVGDYVGKIAQSARTSLTWDPDTKTALQLRELDELFSEALVLFENGDNTTAKKNFEVYREKFSFLIHEASDKISTNIKSQSFEKYLKLLKDHARSVSFFSHNDPQYLLKTGISEIALNLDIPTFEDSQRIAQSFYKDLLLEAHRLVSNGDISGAEEILVETVREESDTERVSRSLDSSSLTLLSQIATNSDELNRLASQIKKIQVEKIKSQQPQLLKREIVSGVVLGTAYHEAASLENVPFDEKNNTVPEDERLFSKIVGQALKHESDDPGMK